MSAIEIPVELGHVIPHPQRLPEAISRRMSARCADCGDGIALTAAVDDPLCASCRALDVALSRAAAVEAWRSMPAPIEVVSRGPRPFGMGSGEIRSGDLVESMRRDREDERDSRLCSLLTLGVCVLEGLLLLGAAALR